MAEKDNNFSFAVEHQPFDDPKVLRLLIKTKDKQKVYDYVFQDPEKVNWYKSMIDDIGASKSFDRGMRFNRLIRQVEKETSDTRKVAMTIQAQKLPEIKRDIVGDMTAEFFEDEEDLGMSVWILKDLEGELIEITLNELFEDGKYIYDDVSGEEYGKKLIRMVRNIGPEDAMEILHAGSDGMVKYAAYLNYDQIDLTGMDEKKMIGLLMGIINEVPLNDKEREKMDNLSRRIKEELDSRNGNRDTVIR